MFHYVLGGVPDRATQWLAGNELLVEAEKRFASYFRRKGWISEAEADEVKQVAETDNGEDPKGALAASSGGAGMRLVVEYVIMSISVDIACSLEDKKLIYLLGWQQHMQLQKLSSRCD